MGKKIIQLSHWSRKSLFSLYGKAVTILFALYCVASGQIIKTASANGTIKSRALFAADSTPLKNIKLYLCSTSMIIAKYGVISIGALSKKEIKPSASKRDSSYTDSNGYFELSDTIKTGSLGTLLDIETENVTTGSQTTYYRSTTNYSPKGNDTIITMYMTPMSYTGVKNQLSNTKTRPLYTIQGKTITIKIPEWVGDNKRASVVNINGEIVTHLQTLANGDIHWNTESVAKGLYFLDIANSTNHLNVKIVVK